MMGVEDPRHTPPVEEPEEVEVGDLIDAIDAVLASELLRKRTSDGPYTAVRTPHLRELERLWQQWHERDRWVRERGGLL
jgi:hypothetical protein